MLKDLFLPVTGAATDAQALEAALAVASAYGARLDVGIASPSLAPMVAPWGMAPDSVAAELLDQISLDSEQLAASYREKLRAADVPWDVRIDEARFLEPTDALARQALYADLSLLVRPFGDDADIAHAYFHACLFTTGRPVLVVPPARVPGRFRRVMLAWKPTRQATRALHDAIAVFAPESVEVLVVDPEIGIRGHGAEPGADIAAHLVHHGLQVGVSTRTSGTMSVATTILLHAAEHDADLVIAGGYGHARLREWVLGGATRELLEALDVPVLFSH